MRNVRFIDEAGNKRDHELEVVPRIGERIIATYSAGGALEVHHLRVQDVIYNLDNPPEHQIAIVVAEEDESKLRAQ